MFRDGKISSRMANGGCAQISAYPCESAALTSDGHNFLVRTLIRAFLDSTESSLSLEFNKIMCSAKKWAEHLSRSRTFEEWSIFVSRTYFFRTGLYLNAWGCVWPKQGIGC